MPTPQETRRRHKRQVSPRAEAGVLAAEAHVDLSPACALPTVLVPLLSGFVLWHY